MKANHNCVMMIKPLCGLFPMEQRYKNESKSQRVNINRQITIGCFQWNKDTKMKANHNYNEEGTRYVEVVSNGTKILK